MNKVRWQKFFRGLFIFISASVLALSPSVFAIDDTTLKFNALNNIIFYAAGNNDSNRQCSPSGTPSGNQITWIGDSYTVGAQSIIENKLPGVDIHAKVSKFVSADKPENSGGESGLTILKNLVDSNSLRNYLVFALGTNGGWSSNNINELTNLAGTNTKIILVTSKIPSNDYASSNNIIEQAASSNDNISVANWVSVYDDSFFANDSIHPSSNGGYTAWFNIIYDALSINSEANISSGSDNVSAVYGFLLQSGYNENAAAAIMGNLLNESSAVNPKLIEGGTIVDDNFVAYRNGAKTFNGGFGIAQWTSAGRVANLQAFADNLGLPVTSLEVQAKFLVKEISDYGFSPNVLNGQDLEEATYTIYKRYESPGVSLSLPTSYNDFKSRYTSGAGYNEYIERLNAAKESLSLTPGGISTCQDDVAYTGEFPHYLQCDSKWGSLMYGSGGIHGMSGTSICDSGCGPSSFAMMATALLGIEITPADTSDIAGKAGMHVAGRGSSHDITKTLAEHYGLQYKSVSFSGSTPINVINELLRDGWMIHTSGRGSLPFSSGGHYIGIYSVTDSGKWLLADSGHRAITPTTEFEPSSVISAGMDLSNVWAIKK